MKKIFISLFILSIFATPCFSQNSIEFSAKRKPLLIVSDDYPVVYKPTKLIIGSKTTFIIKANAGSNVSLATSSADSGAPLFYGQKIRLGTDIKTVNGVVPKNGVLQIDLEIPEDKNLDGTALFFEVEIWKQPDYSDIKIAKIISPSGRETLSNALTISLPPKDPNKPTFAPQIPGASAGMMRAMDSIQNIKNGEEQQFDSTLSPYIYQEPVVLQNLRSPELKK